MSAEVDAAWAVGDGDRDTMPDVMPGLPIDRRTVSRVLSIFRSERVRSSCFFEERLPRFDSSKIHSWLPAAHRLQGPPCSAPTHFILRRRQTVQAREPLVGFALVSSLSAVGLCDSDASSFRGFFLLSPFEMDDAGRFPLRFDDDEGYMCSVGGVPRVSEPWEEGEE